MRLTLGLRLSHNAGAVSVSGPTITAAGSIDVSTFKIGTTQTITAGTATATGGGTVTYEVRHLSDGEVKSTLAAYAHVAADDTEAGVAQWRAVETGGTNPGATSWQTVASGTITYPAPTAGAALVDQSFTDDTGVQTYDTSGDFTGSALVYSLTTAPAGVTINSGTGVVSFDTDTLAIQSGTSIVVTATNSGGSVNSGFSLDIVVGNVAPVINGVPTIPGSASEGNLLTATAAPLSAGTPTPTTTWQWLRDTVAISGATSISYTVVAADVGTQLSARQTETNVAGSDSATSAQTTTVTGQQITLTNVSFNGTDTISAQVNRAGTIYWMITDSATETAAAVIAGTGAIDSGNFAVTSGSNNATISYPNVTAGNHYLHIVADAATSPSPSSVDSAQYTFPSGDTTAPILSSATDAANGQTASTGSVSTDEGNGTLYWVVTTSSTSPSAAQVKAGQDNTGAAADGDSGSQAVSATGTQNITPSGLTASTAYTTHFMHEDAAGNQSAVASASGFTTAAGGASPTYSAAGTGVGSGGAMSVSWPTHSTNDIGVLIIEQRGNDTTPATPSGWTLVGTPATGAGSGDCKVTVFTKTAASGAEADVSLADNGNHQNAQIHTVSGASSVAQLGSDSTGSGTAVTLTSGTTGGANRLIMGLVANNTDLDTDQITSWTNGNLTSLTDRGGQQSSAVAGGGFDVFTGEKATAGAVGSTTATLATSAAWAGLILEFSA